MAATKTTGTQKRKFGNASATAFQASGASVNSGAAVVNLIAAVANRRHWITWVRLVNKTAAEFPICELVEDESGTPIIRDTFQLAAGTLIGGEAVHYYDPPLEVGSGKTLGWQHQSATGDTYASCGGYVEDNATPA